MSPGEWTPLSVYLFRDPKIRRAGADAAWLFVASLCHCQAQLTDGFVDAAMVDVLAADAWAKPAKAVPALLREGLWVEVDGGFQLPTWGEWNKPAAEVEAVRQRKSEGGIRRNHEHWHVRRGQWAASCRLCLEASPDGSDYPWQNRSVVRSHSDRTTDRTTDRSGVGLGSPPSPSPSPNTSLSSSGVGVGDPQPVDNDEEDPRIGQVLGLIADRRCAEHDKTGNRRYRARVLSNLRTEEQLDASVALLLQDFPTAPADLLAASLLGEDTRNLAHYRSAS